MQRNTGYFQFKKLSRPFWLREDQSAFLWAFAKGRLFYCKSSQEATMTTQIRDPDLLDELHQELAILKSCIYGLCYLIREYDKDIYNEIGSAASVQLSRFEKLLNQIN